MKQITEEQRDFFKKHFVFHRKGEPATIANSATVSATELRENFDEKEVRRFFAQSNRKNRDEVQVVLKPDVEAILSNLEL
ncbi:MAG: hypothetical protein J5677_01765 [Bacteroidales bacterium]|nr:hypothetical protein [Bacteroidales bacterium]